MDVYGLTGGIGSGKSTVADLLEEYGVPVVSADELSRVVVARGSEGLQAVVDKFGAEVVDANGDLDRRRMASIVFGDAERRRELEAILHPRIRDRFEQVLDALEKAGHEVCVYEVPLLFERNLQGEMKAVLLVTAPIEDRVARVRARDNVTETEVRARIAAQMDEETKRRRADYIVENTGSLDDLRREVEFLLARFLRVGHTARRPGGLETTSGTIAPDTTLPPSVPEPPAGAARPAEDLPSSRPTAVPTGAPSTPSAPINRELPDEEPPPGPPTIQDTGPPPRATPDTIHPVGPPPTPTAPPAAAGQEGKPEHERITRIDVGPPGKKT
ncbi:MAG: dephospho-CoA kinase [Myxococcota bacterium]